MNLADIIAQSQDGQGLGNLAREFGLNEAQTRAAIDELAPAVMAGVRREAQSPDSLSQLLAALASGDHGRYVEGDTSGATEDGNAILGHIFGSKEVSRGVAAHAAASSGIGAGILKQMLPVIAAMVMGALAKRMGGGAASGSGGGLGSILGQILGGSPSANAAPGGGGLGDILGQVLGGGSTGGVRPDAGAGGGLGDVLGQVLGGGAASPTSSGGGISDVLNSIFGTGAPPQVRETATKRARSTLNDVLGGNSSTGNAADELLRSVDRATGRG